MTGQPQTDHGLLNAYDQLLEAHMPPGLLISERRQLVHAFGGAGRFLRHIDGRPTGDLLELIDGNLKLAISGLLPRAVKEGKPVVYAGVPIGEPEREQRHTVTVRPILNRQKNITHFFIAIEPADLIPSQRRAQEPQINVNEVAREQLYSLEGELRHARESLQATIEELETSNEELQASNEELVASNEEL